MGGGNKFQVSKFRVGEGSKFNIESSKFFYALIFNVLQLKTETKNRPLEKLLIFYFLLLTCLINLTPIAKNQLLENASFRLLTGLRPLQKDFDQKGISQGRVFCGRRPPNSTDEAEPRPSRIFFGG